VTINYFAKIYNTYLHHAGKAMPLSLDENNASYQVKGYQPGTIRVNELTLTRSIIVAPDNLIQDWPPQTIAELTKAHLKVIAEMKPAILLLGTGAVLTFPAAEILGDLINLGIGVEVMNTSAAARTYNALTAENRNVVAALIIN
jgi:uncharacterized protein